MEDDKSFAKHKEQFLLKWAGFENQMDEQFSRCVYDLNGDGEVWYGRGNASLVCPSVENLVA